MTLNFPTDIYKIINTPQIFIDAFGLKPIETYKGKTDYLLIFSKQKDIENFKPDLNLINTAGVEK